MKKVTKQSEKLRTFTNPAGFIELHFSGSQNEDTVMRGIADIQKYAQKRQQQHKDVLILVNLKELTTTDLGSHKAAVYGMRTLRYKRAAFYGPVHTQVLLNTLSIISGKQNKLKVFENRVEAVKWLKRR